MAHVLICDDNQDILKALRALLSARGYCVSLAEAPNEALALLDKGKIDLAILDLNYTRDTTSGDEGLALLKRINEKYPALPVIVMTAYANMQIAIKALQNGARDFIEKPWDNDRLLNVMRTQIDLGTALQETQRLRQENQLLKQVKPIFEPCSQAMKSVTSLIQRVAKTPANILITGEHGSGKGVTAQEIYRQSGRADQSLITVNIGAISDTLFESELFGHVKGAFTDARQNREGRFQLADKGTLFLDEIGNLSLAMQAKLLRVIESGEFEPVGSSKTLKVDVRLISATNADLPGLCAQGKFREDLLYRLNAIEVKLPPLRDRIEDLTGLASYFLHRHSEQFNRTDLSFSQEALAAIQQHNWPGNVREMDHCIQRGVLMAEGAIVDIFHLGLTPQLGQDFDLDGMTLEEIELFVIKRALAKCQGNIKQAADKLGLGRSSLYRRLEKFGLSD
jgi:DNA-binding NtrC family response regulator